MHGSDADTPALPRLDAWSSPRLDTSFLRETPGDAERSPRRRQVHGACHSLVMPTPVGDPSMLAWTSELAELLGLPARGDHPDLARVFSGSALIEGMRPFASCYGGHQFGNWAGQLGDGRAISLAEAIAPDDSRWELQLKGAGPTPYSRSGDGRAVLRSSIREFVCSEAMHHLGVPTTRALSLVSTGEQVVRDMFYDGHPRPEPGAVVCRVAPSFLRFGSLEIHTSRGDLDTARTLLDHILRRHSPHLLPTSSAAPGPTATPHETYEAWFEEVCAATAVMITHWMRVGFVHGVMNTDNMSVLGLTIDYGPYGWVDDYDPGWTPNTTDASGRRYRFGAQPSVAAWNLGRLAASLFAITQRSEPLQAALEGYWHTLERGLLDAYADKLGLDALRLDPNASEAQVLDAANVVNELMELLTETPTDMTIFFRGLSTVPTAEDAGDRALLAPLEDAYYEPSAAASGAVRDRTLTWMRDLLRRVRREALDPAARRRTMDAANPRIVPRNYLAQLAIEDAEGGDLTRLHALIRALRRPYADDPEFDALFVKRPEWARHKAGCSMLSCSS